jgi:hypothetical protein
MRSTILIGSYLRSHKTMAPRRPLRYSSLRRCTGKHRHKTTRRCVSFGTWPAQVRAPATLLPSRSSTRLHSVTFPMAERADQQDDVERLGRGE